VAATRPMAIESALVLGAVAGLTLGACQGPLEAPIAAAHPDDETVRRGGTLRLATIGDPTSLDPATTSDNFTAGLIHLLYAGLVEFDAEGKVVPDLAAKIEMADEGRTYRFTLREGVHFHDGSELTAAEVKRSIERALHPSTPCPYAGFFDEIAGYADFTAKKTPHLEGIVVLGRSLLEIRLRERDASFPQLLALPSLRITCPSAGERYSPTWTACGSGPFKLPPGGWNRGNKTLSLVRHEGYFRPGIPYLDGVTWELGSTQIGEGFKFSRGDLDLTTDLTQPDTVRYQSDPRWQPFGAYGPSSQWVQGDAMNTEVPPFDNVEVRRAVAAAIDRDHIVLLKPTNLAIQAKPVPPLPGYDPHDPPEQIGEPWRAASIAQTHDLNAALEHMKKAGFAFDPATGRGGWPLPVPYDTTRSLSEYTAQSIQQDLAKIGIRLELRITSVATWQALTHRRGKSAMSPQGWHADFPDPSNFLESRFATKSIGDEDGLNYAFYSNAQVDSLLERAKHEPEGPERTRLYAEVERTLCDEAPWAFEYAVRFFQVRQPYVRGQASHAVWTTDALPLWLDRSRDGQAQARRDAPLSERLLGRLLQAAR
jgi:ABC-type transport system substrate-binding protein